MLAFLHSFRQYKNQTIYFKKILCLHFIFCGVEHNICVATQHLSPWGNETAHHHSGKKEQMLINNQAAAVAISVCKQKRSICHYWTLRPPQSHIYPNIPQERKQLYSSFLLQDPQSCQREFNEPRQHCCVVRTLDICVPRPRPSNWLHHFCPFFFHRFSMVRAMPDPKLRRMNVQTSPLGPLMHYPLHHRHLHDHFYPPNQRHR